MRRLGLYAWVRHPQYLSLAVTGLGLAILWPRFLTLVLWTAMVGLYVLLARDEERRMVAAFGDQYQAYMARTGRFLPRAAERLLARVPGPRSAPVRTAFGLAVLLAVTLGGAFALRAFTVARLPLWSDGRVSVLAILPGHEVMLQHRMADVLALPEVASRVPRTGAILAYSVPVQYVMQGMIADTGPAYRLYEHHQSVEMIVDWIFHPFRHLEGSSSPTWTCTPSPSTTWSPSAPARAGAACRRRCSEGVQAAASPAMDAGPDASPFRASRRRW